ncbi:mercuric transport protein MerT [Paenibacillus alginolyticus]|uniref:mercuric transport protein MerT n=1 Tax=Paenibacillus alginolyticus TaxID=59839 RepID=UPI00041DBC32|nr:mercuric transport protein MerT [Paenibacillus alginolyticus]MCY9667616.1 mercuric transport protein MerT [Paenibacillus alginolyticus]
MREKLTSWGAVLSAFLMSGCCLGPIILIPLGLSGLAGTLAIISIKYQLFFMIMTLLFLGVSFYLVYGRKRKSKSTVITLWTTTILVLGAFLFLGLAERGLL